MKYTIKYRSKKHNKKHKSKKNKNKTRKHKTRKYKSKLYLKGGEIAVKPFEMLGYPYGASSDSQAALRTAQVKSEEQYQMNKIGGRGGGEPQDTEVQSNVTSGGEDVNDSKNKTMEVPQFYPIGGIKTVYTTTDLSANGNLTSLIEATDSTNDHFATEQTGAGASRRRKYYKRTRRNKRY